MKHYRKQDILSMAAEEGIELIYLQFIDVFGILKNVVIPAGQLEQALENSGGGGESLPAAEGVEFG